MRLLFYRVGEPGRDDMIYTDAGGRTVAWRVDRRYTVDPGSKAEWRALEADGDHTLLTLYTCDPPGLNTRRLIVRAHRVPYDDAARTAERQVDVKGMASWLAVATVLTLTLMAALHPTVQTCATRRGRRDCADRAHDLGRIASVGRGPAGAGVFVTVLQARARRDRGWAICPWAVNGDGLGFRR